MKCDLEYCIKNEARTRSNAASLLTTENFRGSTMAVPTQARVREIFNYNTETGELTYLLRPKDQFGNAASYGAHLKRVGKVAGTPNAFGYLHVTVDGYAQLVHKIIWLHVTGEWVSYPSFEIDHVNGKRSDNRWTNIRKVTKSENQRNGSQRVNNTSGVHGVNWKPKSSGTGGGWVARIWNGPKHVYLGFYQDIEHAKIARKAAERVLGFTGSDRESYRGSA